MTYELHAVPGLEFSETLRNLNSLVPEWPPLKDIHIVDGYWWLVFHGAEVVAFAGMVQFLPHSTIGYLKRCLVLPDHRGHGLQYRLMRARELKARQIGWTLLVSETHKDNSFSAENFRQGYVQFDPEQPWAKDAVYWMKALDGSR